MCRKYVRKEGGRKGGREGGREGLWKMSRLSVLVIWFKAPALVLQCPVCRK